jgi:hypothetical protein
MSGYRALRKNTFEIKLSVTLYLSVCECVCERERKREDWFCSYVKILVVGSLKRGHRNCWNEEEDEDTMLLTFPYQ